MLLKISQTEPSHITLHTVAGRMEGWLVKVEESSEGALAILVDDARALENPVPTSLTVVPIRQVVAVTVTQAEKLVVPLSGGKIQRPPGEKAKGNLALQQWATAELKALWPQMQFSMDDVKGFADAELFGVEDALKATFAHLSELVQNDEAQKAFSDVRALKITMGTLTACTLGSGEIRLQLNKSQLASGSMASELRECLAQSL